MQKYYYTLQYRNKPGARICSQIIEASNVSDAVEIFSAILPDGYSILAVELLPADLFSVENYHKYDDYAHAAQARTETALASYQH